MPRWTAARFELAALLDRLGESEAALAHYQEGLRQRPDHAAAQGNLGLLLVDAGCSDEAIPHLERALALRERGPDNDRAWAQIAFALGFSLLRAGRVADAEPRLEQALAGGVDSAELHQALAVVSLAAGREAEAITHSRAALARNPDLISAANHLAWVLATSSDASLRDSAEAVRLAESVVRATGPRKPRLSRHARRQLRRRRALRRGSPRRAASGGSGSCSRRRGARAVDPLPGPELRAATRSRSAQG